MKFPKEAAWWLLAYVIAMSLVVAVMQYARQSILNSLDTAEAREQWQQWRDDAAKQAAGNGPVQRKIPKSGEPPALVLMRDHYTSCLAMMLLICTAMFGAFAFFLRGALSDSPPTPESKVQGGGAHSR